MTPRRATSRPGCASGSRRSRSRPVTSSRWSGSCSTSRGSRAAAGWCWRTRSTSAGSRRARSSACGCSPSGAGCRSSWTRAPACRRCGATRRASARCSSTSCTTRSSSARTAARSGSPCATPTARWSPRSPTTGSASPKADRTRIFERFYKADRARVRGGGTGPRARDRAPRRGGARRADLGRVRGGPGVGVLVLDPRRASGRRPRRAGRRPGRGAVLTAPEVPVDRLLVATLNILNLADRWAERLPLLLADMATLQPDLMGLQEVVYPMQQDRLLGAAGEGRYEAVRGWAGRPEYGNSLLVKAPLVATDAERLDLGRSRSAHRVLVGLPGGATLAVAVTHLHHPPAAHDARLEQVEALLPWLDATPAHDALLVFGDFNADPREPAYARMCAAGFRSAFADANGAEPPVTWPSGLRAEAMDTDGEPDCLDYIWYRGAVGGPGRAPRLRPPGRRGPDAVRVRPLRGRRQRAGRPARRGRRVSPRAAKAAPAKTAREARTDAGRRGAGARRCASPIAATGGWRPRTRSRRSSSRSGRPASTASSSTSAWRATACPCCSTTRRWRASRDARRRSPRSTPPRCATRACPPSPTSWPPCPPRRSSTSSSRGTATARGRPTSCVPAAAPPPIGRSCRPSRRRRWRPSARRCPAGRDGSTPRTSTAATVSRAVELGCRGIAVSWGAITPASFRRAREAGLAVVAWTVTRPPTFDAAGAARRAGVLRRGRGARGVGGDDGRTEDGRRRAASCWRRPTRGSPCCRPRGAGSARRWSPATSC